MSTATNKGIKHVIVPVHNCCHVIVLNFVNKNAGSFLINKSIPPIPLLAQYLLVQAEVIVMGRCTCSCSVMSSDQWQTNLDLAACTS